MEAEIIKTAVTHDSKKEAEQMVAGVFNQAMQMEAEIVKMALDPNA